MASRVNISRAALSSNFNGSEGGEEEQPNGDTDDEDDDEEEEEEECEVVPEKWDVLGLGQAMVILSNFFFFLVFFWF